MRQLTALLYFSAELILHVILMKSHLGWNIEYNLFCGILKQPRECYGRNTILYTILQLGVQYEERDTRKIRGGIIHLEYNLLKK